MTFEYYNFGFVSDFVFLVSDLIRTVPFSDGKIKDYFHNQEIGILHRHRHIQNIKSRNANKRAQARQFADNTVIQGSAADLIKVAMINIHRHILEQDLPVKMILQVHDELVFEFHKDQVQQHTTWIRQAIKQAMSLSVPLKVDINHGPSWLEES